MFIGLWSKQGVAFGGAIFDTKSLRHLFHSKLVLPTFFKE